VPETEDGTKPPFSAAEAVTESIPTAAGSPDPTRRTRFGRFRQVTRIEM